MIVESYPEGGGQGNYVDVFVEPGKHVTLVRHVKEWSERYVDEESEGFVLLEHCRKMLEGGDGWMPAGAKEPADDPNGYRDAGFGVFIDYVEENGGEHIEYLRDENVRLLNRHRQGLTTLTMFSQFYRRLKVCLTKQDLIEERACEPLIFRPGDVCVHGRFNLIYTGEIASITAKRVKISDYSKNKLFTFEKFAFWNKDFNAAEIAKHNHEEMMHI